MKRFWIVLLFSLVLVQIAFGQNPMEFFHLGADLYIRGQLEQAIQVVEQGLEKFPTDPYLNALKQKLEEKKQQQQQQQNQQQGQQQNKQKEKQNQQQQQKQQQAQKQKEQQQQQQHANEGKQSQKQQGQAQNSQKKKEMTREEAERILRALQEENKKFKKDYLRVPAGNRQVEKDW